MSRVDPIRSTTPLLSTSVLMLGMCLMTVMMMMISESGSFMDMVPRRVLSLFTILRNS